MNEETLLNLIVHQQDWEELLYRIVTLEDLDPWNIDIVKLTDAFIRYLEKLKEFDFRIPAKFILIAALLLKMKIDFLFPTQVEVGFPDGEELEEVMEKIDFSLLEEHIKKFKLPTIRRPVRKLTLEELVDALRKAIAVEERRKRRKLTLKKKVLEEVRIEEIDIEKRLAELLKEISNLMRKLKKNEVPFSLLVGEWKRDKIIGNFVPLLHLDFRGDVDCRQPEFFKEIFIKRVN